MEEAKRLTEILPGEWPDMVRVCLYTGGQRLGDIAKLQWEQINLEGGLIAMTTEKTKRRMNKPIISALKDVLKRRYEGRVSDYAVSYTHRHRGRQPRPARLDQSADDGRNLAVLWRVWVQYGAFFPSAVFCEVNPIPVKEAMRLMDMSVGGYRLPLCEMAPENQKRLHEALKEAGLCE